MIFFLMLLKRVSPPCIGLYMNVPANEKHFALLSFLLLLRKMKRSCTNVKGVKTE